MTAGKVLAPICLLRFTAAFRRGKKNMEAALRTSVQAILRDRKIAA